MSLFGGGSGSGSGTQRSDVSSTSEAEQSQHSSTRHSASPEQDAARQDAQSAHDSDAELEADLSSQPGTESESDEPARPNRFRGQGSTWKRYTAADREVATSLDQLQHQDLAAHLYNAHALKKRVRRPARELAGLKSWQSNEDWLKKGNELQYTDAAGETQTNLVPSKNWTAWPLPVPELPKPSRASGRGASRSGPNDWTIGSADVDDVGEELRDELLATFLRQAKERWRERETADADDDDDARIARSRSRSRSKSAMSAKRQRSASRTDIDLDDEEHQHAGNVVGKRRGRAAQPVSAHAPMFLADDTKARKILDPTINSILGKVDDLALAIRRTRLNHFGRKDYSDRSSQSGFTSGIDSSAHTTRRSSESEPGPVSRQDSRPASRAVSAQIRAGAWSARRAGESITDSDSDSGSDVSMRDIKPASAYGKHGRRGSAADERSPSATRDETGRAGLMDWSEVLGLAAMKGWDPQAIARAAQRCAHLFGESMTLIGLDEDVATKPAPEPVRYTPCSMPRPDIRASELGPAPKRPLFPIGTWRCPHVDCYGHEKDFESPHRVVEHCKRVHGYDPRTNDSDNEERTVGGVHIDGFLEPVVAQRGWSERGKKRQKTARAESADGDVASMSEHADEGHVE
ncbi:N-alpha-acetyltransferase 20 [Pleosporales sp. CAS-2024a]